MKKLFLTALMVSVLSFNCVSFGAPADTENPTVETKTGSEIFQDLNVDFYINGEKILLDEKAKIINGNIILPFNEFAPKLGLTENDYEYLNGVLKVNFNGKTTAGTIYSDELEVDGVSYKMPYQISFYDGLYVPKEFFTQSMGAQFEWNKETNSINISCNIPENGDNINDKILNTPVVSETDVYLASGDTVNVIISDPAGENRSIWYYLQGTDAVSCEWGWYTNGSIPLSIHALRGVSKKSASLYVYFDGYKENQVKINLHIVSKSNKNYIKQQEERAKQLEALMQENGM